MIRTVIACRCSCMLEPGQQHQRAFSDEYGIQSAAFATRACAFVCQCIILCLCRLRQQGWSLPMERQHRSRSLQGTRQRISRSPIAVGMLTVQRRTPVGERARARA